MPQESFHRFFLKNGQLTLNAQLFEGLFHMGEVAV